ncbi:hypothetical protein KTAU_31250 [Thermogemmatispora aurantia]|nr:hypothetical protein KTAU_31250 [Thermogemmatispora aurantia]
MPIDAISADLVVAGTWRKEEEITLEKSMTPKGKTEHGATEQEGGAKHRVCTRHILQDERLVQRLQSRQGGMDPIRVAGPVRGPWTPPLTGRGRMDQIHLILHLF